MRLYFIIGIAILVASCNQRKECIQTYQSETKKNRPSNINWYSDKPFFNIDSTITSELGCEYLMRVFIPTADSSISHKSIMFFRSNKIFMQLIDKPSDTFVLFDLNSKKEKTSEIRIIQKNAETIFQTTLLDKVLTKEQVEVFIFRIKDLFFFFDNGIFKKSEDVIFFVTMENGIIGSYISGNEKGGQEIMIAPAGEILTNYIDYSNIELRLIQ